ncbi:IS21-like element helper ATPase IstB [Sphingobium phenoxybenzoativorans]|uniref:IS21-like element helper ATPase IstB n=1 Tax=Sphingobium phenoxybenzoativorans TaxID=1592790 RepID=UPI002484B675|nr:IS21-like element helper ATPase IstB [Sphingobium phenoxybenzoativorans]
MNHGGAASRVDNIRRSLVHLKMPRALEMLDATLRGIEQGKIDGIEAIDILLNEELSLRRTAGSRQPLRMASCRSSRRWTDMTSPSSHRSTGTASWRSLAWTSSTGPRWCICWARPGTGKSHIATALAVEAVKAGKSVYFIPLADLIASLTKAEREGTLREKIRFLCRSSLLVVDEIGYLPVTPGGGNLFFQLVNARYEKGAMILTSNRGFAEWGDVFGDPVVATALLDRLLHHAVVVQIEGSSYRMRQHADLLPEHARMAPSINPPPLPKRRGRPPAKEKPDLHHG